MKFISPILSILSAAAILLGVALSFVGSFVSISFDADVLSDSFGTSAWHEAGTVGMLLGIISLALVGTAAGLGFAGQSLVARILGGVAAPALLLAILLLVIFVVSNNPDELGGGVNIEYGLGWSGYAVLGLFGIATVLSVVAAVLPSPSPTVGAIPEGGPVPNR